ncbi:MAG: TonB-dependent receptor [Acidobacteria bacterium]|nr:TonB-dependent receptor [Acidobacteriota bacterium]
MHLKKSAGRHLLAGLGVLLLGLILHAPAPSAQGAAASGVISGTITDESGAALPGVTATLTSPALQVRQVIAVSDPQGNYRFGELPVGTYRITYDLQGFTTFVRDELRLPIGFAARVDVVLKVGTVAETVTVSGESPVIDVTSTSTAVSFTKETLNEIPRGQDLSMIYSMAPGVTLAGTPDVGGSNMANRQNISAGGVALQPRLLFEGMNIVLSDDQNSGVYFNSDSLEETTIRTSGNDAETMTPGISMVAVIKSGGNNFHSLSKAEMESPKLQSNNLDDHLRSQGLTAVQPIKTFYNWQADLGGRLLRDRLWFYAGYSTQQKNTGIAGFVANPGPDGRYLTGDEPIAYAQTGIWQVAQKYSFQLSQNNRVNYVWQRGNKFVGEDGAGQLTPLEGTTDYNNPTSVNRGEFQHVATRSVFNIVGGYAGWWSDYSSARQAAKYGFTQTPSRLDLTTGLATGASNPGTKLRPQDRIAIDAGYTLMPEDFLHGHHEFKLGLTYQHDHEAWQYPANAANLGDYVLLNQTVVGVPNTPVQLRIYDMPVVPSDLAQMVGVYLKDTWRVSNSVTMNLGVRWDYDHTYLPAQSRAVSPDFPTVWPAGSFPYRTLTSWTRVSPRAGVSWDGGKLGVFKAFGGTYGYVFVAQQGINYNQNGLQYITFRWHDLNNDNLYQPGESNLDLNGVDFVSVNGAVGNKIDDSLRQPLWLEYSGSYERQLAPNIGFSTSYVYRHVSDQYTLPGPNVLRPPSAYNIPITRTDPGPDGVIRTADDGGPITFFDYDPAYRGLAFVQNLATNNPNPNSFHTIEFTAVKRPTRRWQGSASVFWVKNHRWVVDTFNAPQDAYNVLDTTWGWGANFNVSYKMAGDILLAASMQSKQGAKGGRTVLFGTVDPAGGTPIAQLGTATIRVTPFGSVIGPPLNVLNLRAGKEFRAGGNTRLGVNVDVFNALNSNAPNQYNFQSGPTYLYATGVNGGILPARVARLGATFSF